MATKHRSGDYTPDDHGSAGYGHGNDGFAARPPRGPAGEYGPDPYRRGPYREGAHQVGAYQGGPRQLAEGYEAGGRGARAEQQGYGGGNPAKMSFARDTLVIFRRQMRLSLRNPIWVIIALVQPVLYLALFAPLLTRLPPGVLGGSASPASGGTAAAYKFFVPGLLIQLGLFGSAFVGFSVISDWRAGIIERLRVTSASRISIMTGRVLRDVLVLVVQAVVLVAVGVAFGLRAPLAAVLISLGFIVLVAIGLASVSYATALLVRSEEAFAPLLNSLLLPLVLLSGIMLPMTLGPGWLQGIARVSPFRYIIDAMRSAFAGQYGDTVMLEGVLVALGLAAAGLWLGSRVFIRENA